MQCGNHSSVVEINPQFEKLDLLSGQPKGGDLGFACHSGLPLSPSSVSAESLVQTVATKHNEQFKYLLGILEC